jgi:hypothetical protein
MRSKHARILQIAGFKLNVMMYATQHDNRSTKKHFGSPPTEKMICEWTKRERTINVKEE